jgi:hypothetical protein
MTRYRTYSTGLPDWTDKNYKVGDRVRVTQTGRTGTIVSRRKPARDGWNVRWDNPMYGVEVGRVATLSLERE